MHIPQSMLIVPLYYMYGHNFFHLVLLQEAFVIEEENGGRASFAFCVNKCLHYFLLSNLLCHCFYGQTWSNDIEYIQEKQYIR